MIETLVKEILLRAKKEVFTGNLGNTLTAFKGDGIDFAEIREYNYGDDVRKINWKATAKTGDVKLNVFNEERELSIIVAFMLSGTINFGTVRLKQEVMAELLALLSFLAIKNADRLSTLFFSDDVVKFIKPTKSMGVVEESLREALTLDPIGKRADFEAFCTYLNATTRQKSMILLISDFYGEIDLSTIAHRHQIYALMVRDRFEELPQIEGEFTLVDPVSGQSVSAELSPAVAQAYQQMVRAQDEKLYAHFLEHKITYGKIYTDEDLYVRASQILKG